MENIINKLGHSRLLEYFLIMWIVTLAIKLIDRSMYYILVLTENKKRTGKIQALVTIILKFGVIMLFLIVFYIMFKRLS
jgi:hypothetical protein